MGKGLYVKECVIESFSYRRRPEIDKNLLGLGGIAVDDLTCGNETRELLAKAQEIEARRKGAGFNPDAIKFLYPDGQLCLEALGTIVTNLEVWEVPSASPWAIDPSPPDLM